MLKAGGFSFAIIDNEHGYFDFSQLAAMIGIGNAYEMPVIVRVPGVDRNSILKVLDMGADGILVPMVNTVEQAKEVVSYSKYAPIGNRGISVTRAHSDYKPPVLKDYFELSNRKTVAMIQLETKEAIANADKISSLQGIDAIFVGPNDLSGDMGIPGQVDSGEVLRAMNAVAAAGKRYGKKTGVITSNEKLIMHCFRQGFSLISYSSELGLLLKASKNAVQDVSITSDTVGMVTIAAITNELDRDTFNAKNED